MRPVPAIPARPMVHRKRHLPEKTCVVCQRPFAWRKKWEKVWDEVRYCSDACRARRGSAKSPPV